MFRKLVKGIFKLGLYAVCGVAALGAWDFMQQAKATDAQYGLVEHAASLSDRYGEDVRAMTEHAVDLGAAGIATAVAWADAQGVFALIGMEAPAVEAVLNVDTTLDAEALPTQEAPIVLAAVDAPLAPETSLFPQARSVR